MAILDTEGYAFDFINTSPSSYANLKVYMGTGGGAIGAEAAHTHAVALDGGATGAEAAHTHAVALDSGASGAGSSHTHGTSGLSNAGEASHTHAVALDTGTSGSTSGGTPAQATGCSVADASGGTPSQATGVSLASSAVTGTLAQANSTQTTSTKVLRLYTGTITGTTPSVSDTLLQAVTGTTGTISVVGVGYIELSAHSAEFSTVDLVTISSGGTFTPVEVLIDAWTLSPASAWLYQATSNSGQGLGQFGPTTALITNTFRQTTTLEIETWHINGWTSVVCGYVGLPTVGSLSAAAQAVTQATYNALATHGHGSTQATYSALAGHDHGPGTLADAASGAGSSHTHTFSGTIDGEAAHTHGAGSLADAASAAGSSHTHGFGNLTDTASGAGSSHTHSGTMGTAAEVPLHTNLSAIVVDFVAYGY
jgi:hypothetical protein